MSPLPPLPSTLERAGTASSEAVATSALQWRWLPARSPRLWWSLYTFACFLVFLLFTFPVDIVLQRVIAAATRGTPVRVRYAQGELGWRGAVIVRSVTIEHLDSYVPPLKLTQLTLQPSWLRLLFGHPLPLAFQADLYGGTLGGTITHGVEGFKGSFFVQRLNLALLPTPAPGKPGSLKGLLTGSGNVQGDFSQPLALQGVLELALADGALQPGALGKIPLPTFQSLHGTLRAAMQPSGRVTLSDVIVTGDGIEARLSGSLALVTPFPRSSLELQLTTKVVGAPPPTLVALVSLLPVSPHVPGERRATISGTFAAPMMR